MFGCKTFGIEKVKMGVWRSIIYNVTHFKNVFGPNIVCYKS